jgi:MFS family permease
MLFRFSLYGFLKNQRYFEPFLILSFLEKGLTFFEIGLLIAFREITVILFEAPSGAIADVYGRRPVMILSFVVYIASFLTFALADGLILLAAAMLLFGVGEAFRTGMHKAMIFAWLRMEGRIHERTRYYGYTRSWSKFGSAASVVLAGIFVFSSDSYVTIFYLATIPYLLNIVNLLGYSAKLDEISSDRPRPNLLGHLSMTLRGTIRDAYLRRLLAESMGFEGVFHAV